MVVLSGDVILIILDFLRAQVDHNTLFQCALVSRWLAKPALSILYQLYDSSPAFGGGTEDESFKPRALDSSRVPSLTTIPKSASESAATFHKWVLMWRSIILSTSEGKTYLPYCDYIRYLDLDDFRELLTHFGFKSRIRDDFFTSGIGDLIYQDYESKGHKRLRSSKEDLTNTSWVIQRVGTCQSLQCIAVNYKSNVSGNSLKQWAVHLPRLQTLYIWNGAAFSERADEKIREHCPDFKSLSVFRWLDRPDLQADADAERVLNTLRPNSLETFEVISLSYIGQRTILALGAHLDSLTRLILTNLSIEAIAQLPALGPPRALKKLILTDSQPTAHDESFNETLAAVAGWISQCESLRHLQLRDFMGTEDASLLAKVLGDDRIRLESLQMRCYYTTNNEDFHHALSLQGECLQSLILQRKRHALVQTEESLLQAICKLTELRELDLKEVSDYYTAGHVMTMMPYLKKLERFSVNGLSFDDDLWPSFLTLKNLRFLAIHAYSEFTAEGILDFVSQLGPGNQGFHLVITSAVAETAILPDAQLVIHEALLQNVNGAFDYEVLIGKF
ncbi:conserved hypothetical protein [Talaromyces stipitatus ATCC 10500]|uniref:F-box domain protein n=1 Tax=Talaromyces stipitatus (strain ATCC 10500 / CBS 375.48 / QM 6759 / NRRL 1006) TaxID=441959 RepID=B8M8R1_TALSN|nr:uncharacterized protein TSTA_037880 [Talaromyces stipitatus ATCC 10500]EED20574.1 conserved hypothetical protein [Talaromyces stipitatus ATCC 10500]